MRIVCTSILAFAFAFAGGCGKAPSESAGVSSDERPTVYTVNYPLQYFAQRIAGDAVNVVFPEMDGDPAYWEPQPADVAAYQGADMILLNGASYAKWTDRVSLPSSKIVDTGRRCADRLIEIEGNATHSHGMGGEHAHGGYAFTTWLDPQFAIEQALVIQEAFAERWPDRSAAFARGFAALKKDLEELDVMLRTTISGQGRVPLVMSHPVYQYVEQGYDLNARSVHWEPDVMPDDMMVDELKQMLSTHPARWMVWEGKPLPDAVQLLKGLGMESIVFDPCGNTPEGGDYLTVMQNNVQELRRVVPQ